LQCPAPITEKLRNGWQGRPQEMSHDQLENHVIIVGFGISGRNLARSCKLAAIPYTILEMNPDTVKEQKKTRRAYSIWRCHTSFDP
jgi:CPA2 family monovalent cation:H+ antiporter-2